MDNQCLLESLYVPDFTMAGEATLAIEMIECLGMPAGKSMFETCFWVGRFFEAWTRRGRPCRLIYRKEVKLHLCQNLRAKDANVRRALLDKIGPQGNKKQPGPTYGISKHLWSALAIAVTAMETEAT